MVYFMKKVIIKKLIFLYFFEIRYEGSNVCDREVSKNLKKK
jgi:hypothetical protein